MKPDEVLTLPLADLHPDSMESFLYNLMDRAIELAGQKNFELPCTASVLDGDGNPLWAFEFKRSGDKASCTWLVKPDLSHFHRNKSGMGFVSFVTMEDASGKKVLVKVKIEGQIEN